MATHRVYSYIRFSRPEQLKGDSLRRQMKYAEDYCVRRGHVLDDTLNLRDLGVSAFRGKNATKGALGGFLEAIKLGKVPTGSVLIVENLDRISRAEMLPQLAIFSAILEAGVTIVTTNPEREYTRASVNEGFGIMEAIIHMVRAHEESAQKSSRIRDAWNAKRARISKEKATKKIPFWLSMRPDRSGFDVYPDRAAVVRRIFQEAASGAGVGVILKRLNREGVPAFSRTPHWTKTVVRKLLRGRQVLGELHPHTLQEGKRTPLEPVPDYYPRIIEEDLYLRAQQGISLRRRRPGRRGNHVTNLFPGLLVCGHDGTIFHIKNLRSSATAPDGRRLVSSGAMRGKPGSRYRQCSYPLVENALLNVLYELHADDWKAETEVSPVADLDAQLMDLDAKIEKTKQRAEGEDVDDDLLDLLRRLSRKRKEVAAEREKLLRENSVKPADALTEAQALVVEMKSSKGDERERLRERLRGRLVNLLAGVVITPLGPAGRGILILSIRFRHEHKERLVVVDETDGYLAPLTLYGMSEEETTEEETTDGIPEMDDEQLLLLARSILDMHRDQRRRRMG